MSYILEALKKSEQERTRGVAPTLHAVHAEPSREPKRVLRYYPVLAVLVVAAMIGWLRPWQAEKGVAQVRVAPGAGRAEAPRPTYRRQVAAPAEPPAPPVLREHAPSSQRGAARPGGEGAREIPRPVVKEAQTTKPSRPARTTAVAESPRTQAETVTEPAAAEDVIDFSELPVAVRRALPKLNISGYVNYPGDPSGRMVAIGDRLVREGEEISPGLKLEQITASGAIFGYKGYRFRAPVP